MCRHKFPQEAQYNSFIAIDMKLWRSRGDTNSGMMPTVRETPRLVSDIADANALKQGEVVAFDAMKIKKR